MQFGTCSFVKLSFPGFPLVKFDTMCICFILEDQNKGLETKKVFRVRQGLASTRVARCLGAMDGSELKIGELWDVLQSFGFTERKLALSSLDDSDLIAQQICLHLGCICENYHTQMVWELIHDCQLGEPIKKRLRGDHRVDEFQVSNKSLRTLNSVHRASGSEQPTASSSTKTEARPLGIRHRVDDDQSDARQIREQKQREKWSRELYKELLKVGSEALSGMEFCVGFDRLHLALAGKTRTSTLRRYVKVWQDWQSWKRGSWGDAVKVHPSIFCEYLFTRFDEPCGRTIPGLIVKAVQWFEKVACFDADSRVSDNRMVIQIRDYIVEQLSKEGPPPRRAPRYPAVLIEALESAVLEERSVVGMRILAWAKLIKIWGSLRFDDLQKINPKFLSFRGGRMTTTLRITKTSGPGKRVQELPVCISEHAYIWDGSWLKVGFDLLKEGADFERDYLIPRFDEDWCNLRKRCASYSDMAAYSCSLRKALRSQVTLDALLPDELASFWTEHSERATLPTGLAMLEVPKTDRDLVGRWKPDASDSYVRSYNGLVAKLQQKFAGALRKQSRSTLLDEIDVVESAESWLNARKTEISWNEREKTVEQLRESLTEYVERDDIFVEDPISDDTRIIDLIGTKTDKSESWKINADRKQGYIVVHNTGKCRRLHKIEGGCWMARSRRFKSSEEFETMPEESAYTHVCKVCWPAASGDDDSSDESTSGSSTTEDSDDERMD